MKSGEVYKVVRSSLALWCKANGFKRSKGGMAGWCRPQGAHHVVFWFQCSQSGWDAWAGSKLIVEFQLSGEQVPGYGIRHRLQYFLTDAELEKVRTIQNTVISRYKKPPADHPILQMEERVASWYRSQFDPVKGKYAATDDLWLRYGEESDVKRWCEFILELLPRIVADLGRETTAPH
jgi:hypothetical protein